MTGSHITEQYIFKGCGSDQHKLLNVTTYKPCKDDLSQNYDLDFLDNYHNWNKSPNVTGTTNSGANTAETNIANQEHQNYYNQQVQQYIACKYNSGLEQVTLELVPNITLEKGKDGFH